VTNRGFTLVETLVVVTLMVIMASAAVPLVLSALDRSRTAGAATHLASRLMLARFQAVKRSTFVAVQFIARPDGVSFRTYVDGNGDGVRAVDIAHGIDVPIDVDERLDGSFPGVTFGICQGVTPVAPGETLDSSDPIQIGASTLLSFNPDGSSTAGTIYVRGVRSNQFAVRVLGVTARVRVLRFDFAGRRWQSR
jgi:prepilin-type N-terminal cleavage/methylation domain-containing protein